MIANISGMDRQIENRSSTWSTTFHPLLREKTLVNFGPQTKKLYARMLTYPTGLFSGDYISTPIGCWSLKFFTRPTSLMNCISSQTWGAGRPQVGLCPIFLVYICRTCSYCLLLANKRVRNPFIVNLWNVYRNVAVSRFHRCWQLFSLSFCVSLFYVVHTFLTVRLCIPKTLNVCAWG